MQLRLRFDLCDGCVNIIVNVELNSLVVCRVDDLKKKLGEADKAVETNSNKIAEFGKKAAAAFAVAAAAAVAYGTKLAIDGVKAAIEDEQAQLRLAAALRSATGATEGQIRATEDFILQTSLATGVADDQLRPAIQRLVELPLRKRLMPIQRALTLLLKKNQVFMRDLLPLLVQLKLSHLIIGGILLLLLVFLVKCDVEKPTPTDKYAKQKKEIEALKTRIALLKIGQQALNKQLEQQDKIVDSLNTEIKLTEQELQTTRTYYGNKIKDLTSASNSELEQFFSDRYR